MVVQTINSFSSLFTDDPLTAADAEGHEGTETPTAR